MDRFFFTRRTSSGTPVLVYIFRLGCYWSSYLFFRLPTLAIVLCIIDLRFDIKFVTLIKDSPNAPFSIATTPRCTGGCSYNPWIAPFYPWSLPYSAEYEAGRHQVSFDPGLKPGLHWRTLNSLGQSSSSSTSSCRASSTDIPDLLSPLLPIIHRFCQVFRATSCFLT